MKLNSELDVLLATARELVKAEDDAEQQTTQLFAALMRSHEAQKRTRALAQATAQRLRVVARRLDLATSQALAKAPELAALEALVTRALETRKPRVANVVLLRTPPPRAPEDLAGSLQAALREVLSELNPRQAAVMTGIFGIDLTPGAPFGGRYPQHPAAMAKALGVSEDTVYLDFAIASESLRDPARAQRLRPFYDALVGKRKRGSDVRLLRFIFEPNN